ncbi:MAG: sulfur reduction protein DsrE [Candidatus Omnitrophica bacterium]|nr:sulfur reduction protein DsrE [Candidatus Omnitrophota bacterium]
MSQKYLLIESRDSFDSADLPYFFNLAKDLAAKGSDVILYLIQNAVFGLRKGVKQTFPGSPVKILADDFSLRERGIKKVDIIASAKVSNVDELVDLLLEENRKAVWH